MSGEGITPPEVRTAFEAMVAELVTVTAERDEARHWLEEHMGDVEEPYTFVQLLQRLFDFGDQGWWKAGQAEARLYAEQDAMAGQRARAERAEAVVAAQREALRKIAGQNPHSAGAERWSMKIARAALDAERKPENPVRGTVHSASAPEGVSEPRSEKPTSASDRARDTLVPLPPCPYLCRECGSRLQWQGDGYSLLWCPVCRLRRRQPSAPELILPEVAPGSLTSPVDTALPSAVDLATWEQSGPVETTKPRPRGSHRLHPPAAPEEPT